MQIEPERFDLIGQLAAGYPAVVIAEQTIEVYAQDLADIPLERLSAAIELCRQESKYFPTVAELRERVDAIKTQSSEPPSDCPRCFGQGMEILTTATGYRTSRRCDHITTDEDVSMF
jgi:hypothetical protein